MDFSSSNNADAFLRLSEISAGVGRAISSTFGERLYWIVAEISELNVRKGHCYLSLVEKLPGAAAPLCEMKGIIWSTRFESVSRLFSETTGTSLAANHVILFRASVRYDVKWGLSLTVSDIEPKYTVGQMQLEREKTVAALQAEKIFDHNRNLNFPLVPQRVAVISAKDSRGYEDFMKKLSDNPEGYRFNATLFSSLLQGDKAVAEMVNRLVEIFHRLNEFDVVVIVRGGGGVVDLNCFNDYKLARAIARFPIPVITGIGHTANRSVSDEVAFADCITPTDAADFLVLRVNHFKDRLGALSDGLHSLTLDALMHYNDQLEELAGSLNHSAVESLDIARSELDEMAARIRNCSVSLLKDAGFGLKTALININHFSAKTNQLQRQRLMHLAEKLKTAPLRNINIQLDLVQRMEQTCRHLDPANVLKRGFSITLADGKAVKSSGELKKGQILKTVLYEGSIESEIK